METIPNSLSKESILKIIENKKINIENFQGFLIWTQIPNIESILKEGFKSGSGITKITHWKYQGRLKQPWEKEKDIYITFYDPEFFSFKNKKLPWASAGQVGVLIDKNLDQDLYEKMKEKVNNRIPIIASKNEFVEHKLEKNIPPDKIKALVLNWDLVPLENPRDKKLIKIPNTEGIFADTKINKDFDFSYDKYKEILLNRLNRLIGSGYEKNLTPLYDTDGEIIWPLKK